MNSPTENHNSDDILDLTQVAKSIYRSRWSILIAAMTVGFASIILTNLLRDTYDSTVSIRIDSNQATPLPSFGISSILASSSGRAAEAEAVIIESRSNLLDAIELGGLDTYVEPAPLQIKEAFLKVSSILGLAETSARESAPNIDITTLSLPRRFIDHDIEVEYVGNGEISVELPDGERMDGLVGSTIRSASSGAIVNISDIYAAPGEKFIIRKDSLENALSRLTKNMSVGEIGSTGIIEISYKDYSPQRVHNVLRAVADSYIAADDRNAVNKAQQSLEYVESQVEPALKAIEDAEDALTRYRKEAESVNVELETEYLLKQMLEVEQKLTEDQRAGERQTLERIRNEYRTRLAALPDTQQQTLNLTRDIEVAQTLYLELMKRVQDMRALRVSAQGIARIIDQPYAPSKPSGPSRLRLVLVCVMAATFIHMLIIALGVPGRSKQ